VFVNKDGTLKLGDFGISKSLDATSDMAATAVGTPYYLCPEICKGDKYSLKSDMWSLGIILYELCTLKRPFQGENIYSVMKAIMNTKFEEIPNN
jgi:NIMA (never in mitosis gene a)-related kinase